MKKVTAVILLWVSIAFCFAADDYELHIHNLAAGTPQDDIRAALTTLDAAGLAAFPTLIAHFADTALAEPRYFQREIFDRLKDGSYRVHPPTIGEGCFAILQGQIEGNWPKRYRQYYVLTPSNTKQWIEAHRGFTLPQLRRASLEESLRRAKADAVKYPSREFLNSTVAFLQKELEGVKE